jgi:excisionase family DNA binding protein
MIEIKLQQEDIRSIAKLVALEMKSEDVDAYTVKEVSDILGCHRNTVIQYIKKGYIKAARTGKSYVISKQNLKSYLNEQ